MRPVPLPSVVVVVARPALGGGSTGSSSSWSRSSSPCRCRRPAARPAAVAVVATPSAPTPAAAARLLGPHPRVHPFFLPERHQLLVRAHLGHFALGQHDDAVGVHDRAQAVRHDQRRAAVAALAALPPDAALDVRLEGALGVDVEGRGGLVCVLVFWEWLVFFGGGGAS